MAFKKKETSKIVEKATVRQSGMEQIDAEQGTTIDYGGATHSITANSVQADILSYHKMVGEYNKILEQADAKGNDIKALEKAIGTDYSATLKSAVGKFGANSNEVEMLGGTRKEERKRPVRKPKTT